MSSAWALIEDRGELLFIRRAFKVGRGGQWCPPGGTIWRNEWPEVACVREAFEETGLRVTIERPIAVFESAHYFVCRLNGSRDQLNLRARECIDFRWVSPTELLRIGTIMDLRRIIPILELGGFRVPDVPRGLVTAIPKKIY
ncbi:NUDIX hydrolase [Bradymonadaceae bacterium TMQ3]|uniref:NUDIX hydrolase n=1 Tax=Lujinxingia sediminis TaxID=2480984 RepID=A0ABY0CV42_9DELT|nr:NUDIX hydrolase [Lujinxingia sediminis]RDV37270.1 NUDIX hydrolase [Bradymonadaceae bacterium TMQ3]RVU46783.1 NUDIX hydrolase [Lujinxingia sediminis]TXC74793.1 NUDIX hydrolase [Bradymonadales bacterium TMQ1]